MRLFESILISLLLVSASAFATEISPAIGLQWNKPTTDANVLSDLSGRGYRVGAFAYFDLVPTLSLRTGAIWNQRDFSGIIDFSSITAPPVKASFTQKISYLDIPAGVQWDLPLTGFY